MINANELRLGNYVTYLGHAWKVIEIRPDCIGLENVNKNHARPYYNNQELKYIHLTEEWLLKFGWGRSDEHELCNNINDIIFIYDYHFKRLFIEDDKHGIQVKNINYLHQLQNLYFALTGKELTCTD